MRISNTYYNPYSPYIKPFNQQSNKRIGTDIEERDQRHSNQEPFTGYVDYTNGNIKAIDILKDFKMTIQQVGVNGKVLDDVNEHLQDVEEELKKPSPSMKNIRQNFEHAAVTLDQYISESLKKPSDVVSQWIHALFSHSVNISSQSKPDPSQIASAKVSIKHSELPDASIHRASMQNPFINPLKDSLLSESSQENMGPSDGTVSTRHAVESFSSKRANHMYDVPHIPVSIKGVDKLEAADTLLDLGRTQDAEKLYTESIHIARKDKDINTVGKGFYGIGMIKDDQGDVVGALKNYNQAAKISYRAKNYALGAKTHYDMGSIYNDSEKPFLAIEHYHMSLGFDGAADNRQEQVKTLNDIATIYKENSQPKKAYKYYNVAYSLANEEKMHSFQSLILGNVGNLYENMGNKDKATFYYDKALELSTNETFKNDFNQEEYLKSLNNLVTMHLKSGNMKLAKKFLTSSIDFGKKVGDNKIRWTAQSTLLKLES